MKLGALTPTRDLTFVEDTVEGFICAGQSSLSVGEIINIGTNKEISVLDLARLIAKIMAVKISIEGDDQRKRPVKSEVERLMADNSKAKKLLNWTARYDLEEGLQKTIAWFKKNQGPV